MKKVLSVLLTAALLLSLFCPALAAEPAAALVRVDRGGVSRPAATAVLVSVNGIRVMLTADVFQPGDTFAVDGADVTGAWRLGDTGLVLLRAEESWQQEQPLADVDAPVWAAVGCRADQGLVQAPVTQQARAGDMIVVSADPGLLPGAALLDDGNALTGIVIAAIGEGSGRYAALSREGLLEALLNAERTPLSQEAARPIAPHLQPSDEPEAEATPVPEKNPEPGDTAKPVKEETPEGEASRGPDFPAGVEVRCEDGFLLVDWPARLDGAAILVADEANPYVATLTTRAATTRTAAFVGVPGHSYAVWVTDKSPEDFAFDEEEACRVTMPDLGVLNRYDFHDSELYLSLVTKTQLETMGDADPAPKTEEITREGLRSRVLLLQAVSHYQVKEEISENLSAVLFAPDGSCYAAPLAGFLYYPGIMDEDVWHMDLSDCVTACDYWTGLPEGVYTVRYYIHGYLAGEVEFALD